MSLFDLPSGEPPQGQQARRPNPRPAGAEVVPFGKYKGQPVEILTADTQYAEWLADQPWFRERYATIYQTIINYGQEATASPEHNEMQARFLDNNWCLALGCALLPESAADILAPAEMPNPTANRLYNGFVARFPGMLPEGLLRKWTPPTVTSRQFEYGGWDVGFTIEPAVLIITMKPGESAKALPCTCGPCDHDTCPEAAPCRGGDNTRRWCKHTNCDRRQRRLDPLEAAKMGRHCDKACPWEKWPRTPYWDANSLKAFVEHDAYLEAHDALPLRVECKPDLGDDYPAVLRQVRSYDKREGLPTVVARRARFEAVTWEQVQAIFLASGVKLIREPEITAQLAQ